MLDFGQVVLNQPVTSEEVKKALREVITRKAAIQQVVQRRLERLPGIYRPLLEIAAVAGRLGIALDLEAFDRMGRDTPVLVDLKPTGQGYMEDLYKAGGAAAILRELRLLLNLDAVTVSGRTLGDEIAAAPPPPAGQKVVRGAKNPVFKEGGIAFLRGNLAPGGAIIKQAAMDPQLARHEGRAVVFESLEDLANRVDDPALDVAADDVLVLKNAGPKGAPGMPEAGYITIPRKLARAGVKDIVRISDGRMSGTAFGTIVLHVTPESAVDIQARLGSDVAMILDKCPSWPVSGACGNVNAYTDSTGTRRPVKLNE